MYVNILTLKPAVKVGSLEFLTRPSAAPSGGTYVAFALLTP
jgi:hypothetical protein